MKKLLLTAAAVSILSTSSAYAADKTFYVKANAGIAKFTELKNSYGNKTKSNNFSHVGIGAGYHLNENVRFDLMLDHYIGAKPKTTVTNHNFDGTVHNVITAKTKTDATSLLVNGYVDVFKMDAMNIFVGAGVGVSNTKAKHTTTVKDGAGNGATSASTKVKSQAHFAHAFYLGAGYEFMDGITGELSYSYRDMGKTKKIEGYKAVHFKGHHVTAGVRFDI